jgi:hypothetical protein
MRPPSRRYQGCESSDQRFQACTSTSPPPYGWCEAIRSARHGLWPYFATQDTRARRRGRWQELVLIKMIASYRKPQCDAKPFGIERLYTQTSSCHGPGGGAPALPAGIGGGVAGRAHPAGHAPQLGAAGRDSHQYTRTQTDFEPRAPAGPLWSLLSDVYDSGVAGACWFGPITMVLAREVGAQSNTTRRFSMHLLVAAKAHHRPGALHSRHIGVIKGKLHI